MALLGSTHEGPSVGTLTRESLKMYRRATGSALSKRQLQGYVELLDGGRGLPITHRFEYSAHRGVVSTLLVRGSQLLLINALLLLGSVGGTAGEIKLQNGSTLSVTPAEYSRILPHAFYDQALASLKSLFPKHVLLAARRAGVIGEVQYALVCFKETPSSERVVIEASAVHRDHAWNLEAIAPPAFGDTLVQVLEQIALLPSTRSAQRKPASGRR
jgi:hypothetical protein